MFFISVDLAIALVDLDALAAAAGGDARDARSFDDAYVVVDASDAVIVCVADVHLDVAPRLIVERRDATRLVEARLECRLVL